MKHRVRHIYINLKPMIQKQLTDRIINSEDCTEKDAKFDQMDLVNMIDEIMYQTPGKIENQSIIQVLIDEIFYKYTEPFLKFMFVWILILSEIPMLLIIFADIENVVKLICLGSMLIT
jgi:hypothetical protein